MAQQLEPLNLRVTGSAQGLAMSLGKSESEVAKFAKNVEAKLSNIQANIPSLEKIGASIASGFAGMKVFDAFKLASSAEQAAVAFEVLTGSVAESAKLLEEMRTLAAATPLGFTGLQENAKVMLGFGISVKDIISNLETLGDISGGDSEKMKSLTLAFSQAASAGRLMGQDLLQMINAGFNPLQEISKNTGRSMRELKSDMENGAISFDMVRDAFISATQEGGRFNNMLERQAETLAGVTGIAVDKIQQLSASIAAVFAPAVKATLIQITELVDQLSKFEAQTVKMATVVATAVATFASIAAIAPRIVGVFTAIGAVFAGVASGPIGWVALTASLVGAATAAHAVERSFQQYESAAASLIEKQKELAVSSSQLATEMSAFSKAYLEQSEALNKSISEGIKSDKVADTTRAIASLTKQLNEARQQAHELGNSLDLRDRLKEAYSNKSTAKAGVDDLLSRMAGLTAQEAHGFSVAPQLEKLKRELEAKTELYRKAAEDLAKVSRESDGFKAGAEEAFAEATARAEELKKEIDGLSTSLEKNKGYWEAQAKAARKAFELPIDKAVAQMEALNEAVNQGGLEMEIYAKAAAAIKDEFTKAVEAKKELAKPVQFSAAVTKGSAADIQDRFRYRVFEAGQQQTKLQEEGNRILNRLDQGMQKLISKTGASPVANIA